MGIGGNFWDLLKPYVRRQPPTFLRDKRVAVDLSLWIVQHDAAIRANYSHARSPHLRLTFFRTVALFSKMGAYPVFIVDGEPSPLKGKARIERFLKGSGVNVDDLDMGSQRRNAVFARYILECVELLELLGVPVIKAQGEAEALCAQLNREGHVDACMTSDSDAFLYGATCVIKSFQSNSREPFECYDLSDIEAALGLRRNQLIAISLLVGNDHDLGGLPGCGVDTAVRFVQLFPDDEILDRISEIGKGDFSFLDSKKHAAENLHMPGSVETATNTKPPHCSQCGHPGNKIAHMKVACKQCFMDGSQNCIHKPIGFRCQCSSCEKDRIEKEQRRHENWLMKICNKIAEHRNFPNKEIIDMYLCDNHRKQSEKENLAENDVPDLVWNKPDMGRLVDFLTYHQKWQPSYIRRRTLPILSTIFFRQIGLNPNKDMLLADQYQFHSILRVKIKHGHPCYLIKWKKAGCTTIAVIDTQDTSSNEAVEIEESGDNDLREFSDIVEEPDAPEIFVEAGSWYLLTEENIELVQAAFPEVVEQFMEEKRIKEAKLKQRKLDKTELGSGFETPKSDGVQLSITQFYRSTKSKIRPTSSDDAVKMAHNNAKKGKNLSDDLDNPIPKSVKRRLLFD